MGGEAPGQIGAVSVHVTVLDTSPAPNDPDRGRRMAEALERIAARGGLAEIADPLAWEREMREDRPVPGREP